MGENISAGMPVEGTGGPWPHEWVDLFNRWVDSDYARLELATTQTITVNKFAGSNPGTVFLAIRVTGNLPAGQTYRVWVDFEFDRKTPFEYVVYQEVGGGNFADTFDYTTDLPFSAPEAIQTIVVRDASGLHTVSVT
jgi:hypothetical protein